MYVDENSEPDLISRPKTMRDSSIKDASDVMSFCRQQMICLRIQSQEPLKKHDYTDTHLILLYLSPRAEIPRLIEPEWVSWPRRDRVCQQYSSPLLNIYFTFLKLRDTWCTCQSAHKLQGFGILIASRCTEGNFLKMSRCLKIIKHWKIFINYKHC